MSAELAWSPIYIPEFKKKKYEMLSKYTFTALFHE